MSINIEIHYHPGRSKRCRLRSENEAFTAVLLYIYDSFSVRIKTYYRAQKYVPFCILIVNGPCLQRKLSEIRHELVIHRLTLL